MNTAITNCEDREIEYQTASRKTETPTRPKRSQRATYARRRGKIPSSHNGMHRRRNKKVRWS